MLADRRRRRCNAEDEQPVRKGEAVDAHSGREQRARTRRDGGDQHRVSGPQNREVRRGPLARPQEEGDRGEGREREAGRARGAVGDRQARSGDGGCDGAEWGPRHGVGNRGAPTAPVALLDSVSHWTGRSGLVVRKVHPQPSPVASLLPETS